MRGENCLLMSPNCAEELVSEERHLGVFKIIIINCFPASPALLRFNDLRGGLGSMKPVPEEF